MLIRIMTIIDIHGQWAAIYRQTLFRVLAGFTSFKQPSSSKLRSQNTFACQAGDICTHVNRKQPAGYIEPACCSSQQQSIRVGLWAILRQMLK